MMLLYRLSMIFMYSVVGYGFSPYFYMESTTMTYDDSVNFCNVRGMDLATIQTTEVNSMVSQYLHDQGVTDRVWISLKCPSQICSWLGGNPLTWNSWNGTEEPIYECVVMEDISNGLWITRKCTDLYQPLCLAPPLPGMEIVSGDFDYYEASAECQSIGGQLAILNNPVAITIAKDIIFIGQSTDIWIGLYGDGTNLVWQNVNKELTHTDWMSGTPIPAQNSNIGVAMDSKLFTWKARPKTDRLAHALCQYNFMAVGAEASYYIAQKGCTMYALGLAFLRTDEEFILAKNAIVHQGITDQDFWIGSKSNGIEFKWNGGASLDFSAWVPGAPSIISNHLYVEMDSSQDYKWNNRPESELNGYLCRYPIANKYPISKDIVEDFTTATSTTETSISTFNMPTQTVSGGVFRQHTFFGIINSIPVTQSYFNGNVRSRLQCAEKCLTNKSLCTAFVYNNQICKLYNDYSSNAVIDSIGSITWF